MLAFRDARNVRATSRLVGDLAAVLNRLPMASDDELTAALLEAGELEAGLADREAPFTSDIAAVTDVLASALLGQACQEAAAAVALQCLSRVRLVEYVTTSVPEGFAYYALHPRSFAELTASIDDVGPECVVVGIRSIGTTLSAVVLSSLRARNVPAFRLTIRPFGPPLDRTVSFSPRLRETLLEVARRGGRALVVDEGPGLSGSTFLATGEALVTAGFSPDNVCYLCSHPVDPHLLAATNAVRRWSAFRTVWVEGSPAIPDGGSPMEPGAWRACMSIESWPPCWPMVERRKGLSRDGRRLFKFEGLGGYGDAVWRRADALHEAGVAPRPERAGEGYVAYEMVNGMPAVVGRCKEKDLTALARYCAIRTRACAIHRAGDGVETILGANRELLPAWAYRLTLEAPRPVVADARMMPYEWLASESGLVKTDGVSHGDDHFFPGPTDIAWDLAGVITEWQLSPDAAEWFLRIYRRFSGDEARGRLLPYLIGYALFGIAYTDTAAGSMPGLADAERMRRANARYRQALAGYTSDRA